MLAAARQLEGHFHHSSKIMEVLRWQHVALKFRKACGIRINEVEQFFLNAGPPRDSEAACLGCHCRTKFCLRRQLLAEGCALAIG